MGKGNLCKKRANITLSEFYFLGQAQFAHFQANRFFDGEKGETLKPSELASLSICASSRYALNIRLQKCKISHKSFATNNL